MTHNIVAAYAVGLDRKETSIKEFLNLWICTPHECTRNWAASPKIECYLTINLTLPPHTHTAAVRLTVLR